MELTFFVKLILQQISGVAVINSSLIGTSLVVQWLRLYALNAENLGLIPNQGTKSHLPQIRSGTAK